MKRKVYKTGEERRKDQAIGFWLFPIVNFLLWAATTWLLVWTGGAYRGVPDRDPIGLIILSAPWFVNGIILALAFIFRPQIGVGYIAFIGVAMGSGFVLAILVVGACFISLPFWFIESLGVVVWLGLIAVGLIYLGKFAIEWINEWTSQP